MGASIRGGYTQEADYTGCGICGADGGHEIAEARYVRRIGGGRRLLGGGKKKIGWGGVSWTTSELSVSTPTSGRLQPRTRGNEWLKTAKQGAERFVKWIAVEKARAALRHAITNGMSERDGKDRGEDIAQSKRVGAGSVAIVD